MESLPIECKCGKIFQEAEFTRHFQLCADFKNQFRQFDTTLGELLKSYSEPKENLKIVRILLKQYIGVLERKISSNFSVSKRNSFILPKKNEDSFIGLRGFGNENNFSGQMDNHSEKFSNFPQVKPKLNYDDIFKNDDFSQKYYPAPKIDFDMDNKDLDISFCQRCKSPDILYLECCHPMCKDCLIIYAEDDFSNMKCSCGAVIKENYKKAVLGNEKYDELDKKFSYGILGQLVECPSCKEKNAFEAGKVDYNIRDEKNEPISREACEDYAKNRIRCPQCQNNFCAECKALPYHLGKTCEQFKNFKKAKKCKYCNTEITSRNQGREEDVCKAPDCFERYKLSCKKILPCGHRCFGCNSDLKCPPCLNSECPTFRKLFDQDADSYCNICFTEGLGSSPIVLLSCNHYIHFQCVEKRLSTKWVGPKITFNHCLCPACNNWYECPSNPIIQNLIIENKKLYKEISEKALKRLKFEDLDKDPKLTNPKSKWYGKKLEYALNRLCYYMCYKCKNPYFAGRRECGDGPNVNNDNPNKSYDPKDCVCGKCANLSGVAGVTDCKKHGKDFIEYKCKFCCKIASWFCWGTTHFCEDCHARQCKGDYVSKYSKDKLPKCIPGKCELRIKHPPNGEEFALGCSVCRNSEENMKDF